MVKTRTEPDGGGVPVGEERGAEFGGPKRPTSDAADGDGSGVRRRGAALTTDSRMSATLLVELGERYAALGLPAAARAAWVRARAAAPDDVEPVRRLAELAVAEEDAAAARAAAEELVARAPDPAARLLLARAQLAAGEAAAARRTLSALLDGPAPAPLRARAHVVRSQLALAESDRSGAAAHALAAFDAVLEAAVGRSGAVTAEELALAEAVSAQLVAADRGGEAAARLAEQQQRQEQGQQQQSAASVAAVRAALAAARHAGGDAVAGDAAVEQALAAAAAAGPDSWPLALRLAEHRLRRGRRNEEARAAAAADLGRVADELAASHEAGARVALGRALMTLAAAREGDSDGGAAAEAAYRDALAACPGLASAAGELAALALAAADYPAAEAATERALRGDPAQDLAWRDAARVIDALSAGTGLRAAVARLLEAAEPAAGVAAEPAARLVGAVAEVARGDVLDGVHARGHRLKNLLGIIGSRARSARKLAGSAGAEELENKLVRLEEEITAAYTEWAAYLRSMHAAGPVFEVVAVAPLVKEVAGELAAAFAVGVSIPAAVPDVRGDRALLREALLNVVTNAVEACAEGGGVEVVARGVLAGGAPVVEIEVADTGSGIAPADMARVFSPGFTTKQSGSGVGLAIAERVVAAHRGRLLLDSELGRGTRVTLVLRCDPGRVAAPRARAERSR